MLCIFVNLVFLVLFRFSYDPIQTTKTEEKLEVQGELTLDLPLLKSCDLSCIYSYFVVGDKP